MLTRTLTKFLNFSNKLNLILILSKKESALGLKRKVNNKNRKTKIIISSIAKEKELENIKSVKKEIKSIFTINSVKKPRPLSIIIKEKSEKSRPRGYNFETSETSSFKITKSLLCILSADN